MVGGIVANHKSPKITPNPSATENLRNIVRADRSYRSSQTGRWFNHTTGEMEDYTPKKREFKSLWILINIKPKIRFIENSIPTYVAMPLEI